MSIPDKDPMKWEKPDITLQFGNVEVPTQSLRIKKVVVDKWPYLHADIHGCDRQLGEEMVFGVPFDREAGMAYYVIQTRTTHEKKERPSLDFDYPTCPYHDRETTLTKKFDFLPAKIRYQFKCCDCFLTRYEEVKR